MECPIGIYPIPAAFKIIFYHKEMESKEKIINNLQWAQKAEKIKKISIIL